MRRDWFSDLVTNPKNQFCSGLVPNLDTSFPNLQKKIRKYIEALDGEVSRKNRLNGFEEENTNNLNSVLLEGVIDDLTKIDEIHGTYIDLRTSNRDSATGKVRSETCRIALDETFRCPTSGFHPGDLIRVVGRLRRDGSGAMIVQGEFIEKAFKR